MSLVLAQILFQQYYYSNVVAEPTNDCRVMFGIHTFLCNFFFFLNTILRRFQLSTFTGSLILLFAFCLFIHDDDAVENVQIANDGTANARIIKENLIKMCKYFERIYLKRTHRVSCEHFQFWIIIIIIFQ